MEFPLTLNLLNPPPPPEKNAKATLPADGAQVVPEGFQAKLLKPRVEVLESSRGPSPVGVSGLGFKAVGFK